MGVAEDARQARRKKRGAITVDEAERVRADRRELARFRRSAQADLFKGEILPDDELEAVPGKAGRPLGARNVAPAAYRRHILATKGDFLGRLAGIANADTLQLANVLGCSPVKALEVQGKLAATAAPYVYTAQPRPEEAVAAAYYAGLIFRTGGAGPVEAERAGGLDALAALAGRPVDMQQIQALGPVEFAQSEQGQSEQPSDDEDKAP